jgi:hypothetical protein
MKDDQDFPGMSCSVVVFGVLVALGLVLGAFILGYQTRHIGSGRSSITIKGLAEKPVRADMAEWQVTAVAYGVTFAETVANLRNEKSALESFVASQGFDKASVRETGETVEPRYEDEVVGEQVRQVQHGFVGRYTLIVSSRALDRIVAAHRAALDYKASGHNIEYANPSYLVSGLEEIKMSLIGAATDNAKKRAQEFVKHSDAKLGAMRSASQGAFYILPPVANASMEDYGGTYDKTTIDKIARVVVTIEFSLQ